MFDGKRVKISRDNIILKNHDFPTQIYTLGFGWFCEFKSPPNQFQNHPKPKGFESENHDFQDISRNFDMFSTKQKYMVFLYHKLAGKQK